MFRKHGTADFDVKKEFFLHESSRQFFVNFAVVEIQNANYFLFT